MQEEGKARLKVELTGRLRQARDDLLQTQIDVSLWTAAVELWTELNESREKATATALLTSSLDEQKQLEALIGRLERGLDLLNR